MNESLIETSISKDILMLTRVDKPALMRRLFELGCSYYAHTEGFTLHYWRERNDEVDFVMERKGTIIGLVEKSGATQSMKGMNAFKKQITPDKVLLIGDDGLPWQD